MPVDLQLTLISKILAYDRELEERAGHEIVVGIVYQRRFRSSFSAMDAAMVAAKAGIANPTARSHLRFLPIEISDVSTLPAALRKHEVDILYLTPLRAVKVVEILKLTRDERILTFSGIEQHVRQGVAVGIVARGDRPSIIVNLSAARAQGADFSAQFLSLAEIIESPPHSH